MSQYRVSQSLRNIVGERAYWRCEYCMGQEFYSHDQFEVDHVTPRSRGGTNDVSNLAFVCRGCNGRKGDTVVAVDPVNRIEVPLFNPRTDNWYSHFVWNEDATEMLGISQIGRATVEALQLNRKQVVRHRSFLATLGLHP